MTEKHAGAWEAHIREQWPRGASIAQRARARAPFRAGFDRGYAQACAEVEAEAKRIGEACDRAQLAVGILVTLCPDCNAGPGEMFAADGSKIPCRRCKGSARVPLRSAFCDACGMRHEDPLRPFGNQDAMVCVPCWNGETRTVLRLIDRRKAARENVRRT